MQSELKSLSKIFTETIFRIPDYQRGYAWNEKQLKDFWNDIEQLPDGKGHYTGVLTLEPAEKNQYDKWEDDIWIIESKSFNPLYIVDGQQRLTTAIVLISSIIDHIPEGERLNFTDKDDISKKYISESKDRGISHSYIFGYEKDNPSYEFLKQKIFGHISSNHSTPEDTSYTKNLLYAKSFFNEKIGDLSVKEIESIYTKVTQKLLFNIFYIEKDLDVFVTFETMNNRGKPLSNLELLKNRLIYLSTKFDEDPSEKTALRKSINETWKTIYHYLGKIQSKIHNDDTFLRTHFIFHFGSHFNHIIDGDIKIDTLSNMIRANELYKQYLLDAVFSPRRLNINSDLHGELQKQKKPEIEETKITLKEVYDYTMSIKELVERYHKIALPDLSDFPSEVKIVLHQINRIGKVNFFILTMAVLKVNGKSKSLNALKSIERAAFLSCIRGYYYNQLDPNSAAVDIVNKLQSVDGLISTLDTMTQKFIESKDLADALRNLGKDHGYYNWPPLRYFLYEFEQHLIKKSKSARKVLDWQFDSTEDYHFDYRTVEHICPQTANNQYWKNILSPYNTGERNKLRNSIGNLLPVSHSKNSSLGNKSFSEKKGSIDNQVGYSYGCLSEIQVSTFKDWGAKEIVARGIMLLEFLEVRWQIKLGTLEEKIDILGLRFVLEKENISSDEIKSIFVFK